MLRSAYDMVMASRNVSHIPLQTCTDGKYRHVVLHCSKMSPGLREACFLCLDTALKTEIGNPWATSFLCLSCSIFPCISIAAVFLVLLRCRRSLFNSLRLTSKAPIMFLVVVLAFLCIQGIEAIRVQEIPGCAVSLSRIMNPV